MTMLARRLLPIHYPFTMRAAEDQWEVCKPIWTRFLSIKVGTGAGS
jgi:hypothetical protein